MLANKKPNNTSLFTYNNNGLKYTQFTLKVLQFVLEGNGYLPILLSFILLKQLLLVI